MIPGQLVEVLPGSWAYPYGSKSGVEPFRQGEVGTASQSRLVGFCGGEELMENVTVWAVERELRSVVLEALNRAKQSWCLVVRTKYLAPVAWIRSTHSLGLKFAAVKLVKESS